MPRHPKHKPKPDHRTTTKPHPDHRTTTKPRSTKIKSGTTAMPPLADPTLPPPLLNVEVGFMKVRITGLPPRCSMPLLAQFLAKHGGRVEYIGFDAHRPNVAHVTYDVSPNGSIFGKMLHITPSSRTYYVKVERVESFPGTVSSPSDPSVALARRLVIQTSSVVVGILTGPLEMTQRATLPSVDGYPMVLRTHIRQDVQDFVFEFPGPRTRRQHTLTIRFAYIAHVHEELGAGDVRYVTFTFQHPPKFAMASELDELLPGKERDFQRDRAFRRICDLEHIEDWRRYQPISLHKGTSSFESPVDLGRCLTWRFEFCPSRTCHESLKALRETLQAFNVPYATESPFTVRERDRAWAWHTHGPYQTATVRVSAWDALHSMDNIVLPFEIVYALETAMSKKLMYEGNITSEFLARLGRESRSGAILNNFIAAGREVFEPMDLFDMAELHIQRDVKLPKTCAMIHSVTITPTTMLIHPVQVEVSNRVIRRYFDLADRFLRVRFSDEVYYGRIHSTPGKNQQDEVYERVRRTLSNGIQVGGRHYHFLACGSSQFREHGAYFFAPTEHVTINSIRQWMGYFQHIREIAKYVARIGQCFSTTKAITSIGQQPDIQDIPDIKRNEYTFTDGVGKMSPFLADMISKELKLGFTPPSVYQFRMGGCKGVLAVDPNLSGRAVQIRPSQRKFQSDFNQLEIIRVSSFATAFLNKQLISVLSMLGIPDSVFIDKTEQQLMEINRALEDDTFAIDMLMQQVDHNQITVEIAKMLACGMRNDPLVDSILRLWRVWAIKLLKEKANLCVPKGAFLLGCVDETDTLEMKDDRLPQIFLQVPEQNYVPAKEGMEHIPGAPGYKVVTGMCIIARNPALHPGDIRMVEAVDCAKLHHLRDVVVLPQQGARDLANMCSGGDLDGDDFLVIWDPDLIPSQQYDAMDYTAPPPLLSHGPVTQSDMIRFIVDYMKNDSLGTIAVAHRGWADKESLDSRTCLQLAHLHSMAVDYAKTGVPARMQTEHRLQLYPHWEGKPRHMSYHSRKVLGQVYDLISNIKFDHATFSTTTSAGEPYGHFSIQPTGSYGAASASTTFSSIPPHTAFNAAIISAYPVSEDLSRSLRSIKESYDTTLLRLMAQYGILTEYEVYTAFVLQHNREIREYKFAEELGNLMSQIKHEYRDECLKAGDAKARPVSEDEWDKLGAVVAGCYAITASNVEEHDRAMASAAHAGFEAAVEDNHLEDTRQPPKPRRTALVSFPWIFADELMAVAQMVRSPDNPTLREASDMNSAMVGNIRKGYIGRVDRGAVMKDIRAKAAKARAEAAEAARVEAEEYVRMRRDNERRAAGLDLQTATLGPAEEPGEDKVIRVRLPPTGRAAHSQASRMHTSGGAETRAARDTSVASSRATDPLPSSENSVGQSTASSVVGGGEAQEEWRSDSAGMAKAMDNSDMFMDEDEDRVEAVAKGLDDLERMLGRVSLD